MATEARTPLHDRRHVRLSKRSGVHRFVGEHPNPIWAPCFRSQDVPNRPHMSYSDMRTLAIDELVYSLRGSGQLVPATTTTLGPRDLFTIAGQIQTTPLHWIEHVQVSPDILAGLLALADGLTLAAKKERTASLRPRFRRIAEEWKDDTMGSSMPDRIAMHDAYQQIIAMGEAALPLILEDLRTELNHWFFALSAITSADPVPEADRGKMRKMRDAWLKWGEAEGHL